MKPAYKENSLCTQPFLCHMECAKTEGTKAIPKVSVIIVNYNGEKWLKRSVQSILDQSESDFECFIVDNNSSDNSMNTLPDLDDRFIVIKLDDNTGFAHGNNIAAQRAKAPWIALLNPDAFARANWLEELLKAAHTTVNTLMVGSTQYLALEEPPMLDGFGDCYHISGIAYRAAHKKIPPENLATGYAFGPCGAAALYHREKFLELGGFDERFFCYHEDVDLAFRIQLTGGDCVQSLNAIVDHVGSAISNTVPDFAVYHGTRNRIWTFFKNMPWPLLILLTPLHIGANLAYLSWGLFRKGRVKPTFRGIKDGIKGLPQTFRDRKTIQAKRIISSREMLSKMTWSPIKVMQRGIHIRNLPK